MSRGLERLAARQKRVQWWTEFLQDEVSDVEVKDRMQDRLKEYRNLLAKCWEHQEVSDEDELLLFDLERELEGLDEKARLRS